MNGGILLSFFNMRYFRDQLSIYCEFIPQMVFLNGLFGYLCILIVSKWISGSTADLYHVMIYMFLSPGTGGLACLDASGKYGCKENIMFTGQGPLQVRTGPFDPALCPSVAPLLCASCLWIPLTLAGGRAAEGVSIHCGRPVTPALPCNFADSTPGSGRPYQAGVLV